MDKVKSTGAGFSTRRWNFGRPTASKPGSKGRTQLLHTQQWCLAARHRHGAAHPPHTSTFSCNPEGVGKVGERRVLTCGIPQCDGMGAQWRTRPALANDMAKHAILTALRPTDFRLAAPGALPSSRACPPAHSESAARARVRTALRERCDGDGEQQPVWGGRRRDARGQAAADMVRACRHGSQVMCARWSEGAAAGRVKV